MYGKGSILERELLELFWRGGFACVRSAGSGRTRHPNPDLLVSNGRTTYSIECKSSKQKIIRIYKEQVDDLLKFSKIFGAKPFIAVRFNRNEWLFLKPNQLEKSRTGNYRISLELAKRKGKRFEGMVGGKRI